jgi:hypothetical protein
MYNRHFVYGYTEKLSYETTEVTARMARKCWLQIWDNDWLNNVVTTNDL